MDKITELQMGLKSTYDQLADIAERQRELTNERLAVEANRDNIVKDLGKLTLEQGVV